MKHAIGYQVGRGELLFREGKAELSVDGSFLFHPNLNEAVTIFYGGFQNIPEAAREFESRLGVWSDQISSRMSSEWSRSSPYLARAMLEKDILFCFGPMKYEYWRLRVTTQRSNDPRENKNIYEEYHRHPQVLLKEFLDFIESFRRGLGALIQELEGER